MRLIEGIAYAPEHGVRGLGDLHLPDRVEGAPLALCIHGGGWNAMDKYSWRGVAELMCEQGYAALNVNYRLLDNAPWPACGDDCLRAAEFLLAAGQPAMEPLDRADGAVVIGGSAGGHLALMTGLRLPREKVRAIISVAGPSDLLYRAGHAGRDRFHTFFGTQDDITDRMLTDASPISYVAADAPPLLCLHSTNDQLVPIEQAQRIIGRYEATGARAELRSWAGPGEQHGIWIEGSDPHRLLADPEKGLISFLKTL